MDSLIAPPVHSAQAALKTTPLAPLPCQVAYSPHVVPFMLFLGFEFGAVCCVCACLFRLPVAPPPKDALAELPRQRLNACTALEVALVLLIVSHSPPS
jgi:hypothetical protein